LNKHFQSATPETKALLFSTYMKFVNLYPDQLKDTIIAVFAAHHSAVDPEIQQRAVEYEVMAKYENQDLISDVWEAMPDFPERESNLLKLIKQKESGLTDKDPLQNAENENKNDEREESVESHGSIEQEREKQEQEDKDKVDDGNDKRDDLLNVNEKENVNQPVEEDLLSGLFSNSPQGPTTKQNNNSGPITLNPDPSLFSKAITAPNAILFNDEHIRISVKSQLEVENGIMKAYIIYNNPSDSNLENIKAEVDSSVQGFDIQFSPSDAFSCAAKQEFQQKCKAMIVTPPSGTLTFKITFNSNGQAYVLNLPFPVVPNKFFKAHNLDETQFKQQWQACDKQSQQIVDLKQQYTAESMRSVLTQSLNVGLIEGIDKNNNNAVGCAIWYFGKKKPDGNNVTMGVLVRAELNTQNSQMRITVRTKHQQTSDAVLSVCKQLLQ